MNGKAGRLPNAGGLPLTGALGILGIAYQKRIVEDPMGILATMRVQGFRIHERLVESFQHLLLYQAQRFDSDPERRFAILLEDDSDVLKWIKPSKKELELYYENDKVYEPDFIVETKTGKYLCEPKRASEMTDRTVLAKAHAAATWCRQATDATKDPWSYLLIPHDQITAAMTRLKTRGTAPCAAFCKFEPTKFVSQKRVLPVSISFISG